MPGTKVRVSLSVTEYTLSKEQWLPRPLDEVFPFFSEARNLEELTPPWLKFEVLTPAPIVMRPGALIDYRIKIHGLPIRWRTEIVEWDPPHRFIDVQLNGPYKLWHHTHTFTERDGGNVLPRRGALLSARRSADELALCSP